MQSISRDIVLTFVQKSSGTKRKLLPIHTRTRDKGFSSTAWLRRIQIGPTIKRRSRSGNKNVGREEKRKKNEIRCRYLRRFVENDLLPSQGPVESLDLYSVSSRIGTKTPYVSLLDNRMD